MTGLDELQTTAYQQSQCTKKNDNKLSYLSETNGIKICPPKHLDESKLFLQQLPFEILSLNETRLDETIQNNMVQIPGYEIIRRDTNRRGGGLLFLSKITICIL